MLATRTHFLQKLVDQYQTSEKSSMFLEVFRIWFYPWRSRLEGKGDTWKFRNQTVLCPLRKLRLFSDFSLWWVQTETKTLLKEFRIGNEHTLVQNRNKFTNHRKFLRNIDRRWFVLHRGRPRSPRMPALLWRRSVILTFLCVFEIRSNLPKKLLSKDGFSTSDFTSWVGCFGFRFHFSDRKTLIYLRMGRYKIFFLSMVERSKLS